MFELVRYFVDVTLFRRGPEAAPKSILALFFAIFFSALLGGLTLRVSQAEFSHIFYLGLWVTMMSAFLAALLTVRGHPARLTQTATAVFGADAIISGIVLGLIFVPGAIQTIWWLLLIWSVSVQGFILARAGELSLPISLLIAYAYWAISTVTIEALVS